jgi:hypothetical protein
VLEHVRDDIKAIRELVRILSPQGFALLIVPRTESGTTTEDWAFADPARNFHYRGYGRDFDSKLASAVPEAHVIAAADRDPVTDDEKRLHILTKSVFWRDRLLSKLPGAASAAP